MRERPEGRAVREKSRVGGMADVEEATPPTQARRQQARRSRNRGAVMFEPFDWLKSSQ